MAALILHLRAELRQRWVSWAGVVVLIGLVGGLVLGSLAGARRTDSAFDRMRQATDAWDVLANPDAGTGSALTIEDVRALPIVERAHRAMGVGVWPIVDGEPVADDTSLSLAAGEPEAFIDFGRPNVLEGRVFDTTTDDEVMVSEGFADRYGAAAGDSFTFGVMDFGALDAWKAAGASGIPPLLPFDATIAGVVVPADQVVRDDVYAFDHVYLTNAFWRAHEDEAFFFGIFADLVDRPGAAAEFRGAVQALVPDEVVEFQTMATIAETVERGTMPHVVALLLFALVVGTAGFAVCGQAISRQLAVLAADAPALRALGTARRSMVAGAAGRVVLLGAAGSLLAVGVAAAISPLFPVGVAARAEPSPGLDLDVGLLATGALVMVLVLAAWSVRSVVTISRPPTGAAPRVTTTVRHIDRSSLPPVPAMGLRMAVGGSDSSNPVSVRATVAGLAVAIAAVVTTATFGASLDRFVDTPPAYGWAWDAMVDLPSEGPDDIAVAGAGAAIVDGFVARSELDGLTVLTRDQLTVGGERVPAIGIETLRGDVGPPVVAGRAPGADDEIALGGRTMRLLDVAIGDRLLVGSGDAARQVDVVGQVVFVGMGTYPGADRTELGKGALLRRDTLADVGHGFGFPLLLIESDDPAVIQPAIDAVLAQHPEAVVDGSIESSTSPLRPADVVNLDRVSDTPLVITAVLVALAASAFVHALRSAARTRRRDLALLKTLGFRRRDLGLTIAIQASTLALAAVVIGVPFGLIAGRWGWTLLADRLGILPSPQTPVLLLALVVPAAVIVANLAALGPALVAARTRPATVLRSE